MFINKRFFVIAVAFILLASACTPAVPIPTATAILSPTATPAPFPIPKYSFDIEITETTMAFENYSPVGQMTAFYKDQLFTEGCFSNSESGTPDEAIFLTFNNCRGVASLKIIIFPTNRNSTVVLISTEP